MTPSARLGKQIYALLRGTFGTPAKTGHRACRRWTVRPSTLISPINITLECDGQNPRVWVFDPNDRLGGIFSHDIADDDHVKGAYMQIRQHLERSVTKAKLDARPHPSRGTQS